MKVQLGWWKSRSSYFSVQSLLIDFGCLYFSIWFNSGLTSTSNWRMTSSWFSNISLWSVCTLLYAIVSFSSNFWIRTILRERTSVILTAPTYLGFNKQVTCFSLDDFFRMLYLSFQSPNAFLIVALLRSWFIGFECRDKCRKGEDVFKES